MKVLHAIGLSVFVLTVVSAASSASALDVGLGTDINISGSNGSVNSSTSASVTASIPSMQVRSEDELDVYVDSVEDSNDSITAVSSSDTSVSVGHRISAKLFGFIPVRMTETVSVQVEDNSETSVTVRHPWWSFLASAPDHAATLSARVRAYLPTSVVIDGELDANTKAQFISAIEAATQED